MTKRIILIVRVAGKLWMMESIAASRYPGVIEVVDTIGPLNYKTREAVGVGGAIYRIFIDNSVGVVP